MKRARATVLLEDLLARIDAGARYLDCIDEVWIFGSYARGALEPSDVDVDIEFTPDEEYRAFQMRCFVYGGDHLAPLHREVIARRRGLQVFYDRRELYEQKGIELTLLWRRGEPIAAALSRLQAIKPDPAAGRSERDAMLPVFEGIDHWVPLPIREALVREQSAGTISVERVDLPDATPETPAAVEYVHSRWQEGSPLRRAGLASLAYIERRGGNPLAVHLQGRDVQEADTPHFVGFSWRHHKAIANCLTEWDGDQWIEVVNPTRTKPLAAILIAPLDRERLREVTF